MASAREQPGTFAEVLRQKPLIGMVHLPPLPGSPRGRQTLDEVLEVALDEARILEASGMDGLIVENVGDTPFFRESVPAITVAAMAVIVREVRERLSLLDPKAFETPERWWAVVFEQAEEGLL